MRIYSMRARAHAALREPREASIAMSGAERALDTSQGAAAESNWVQYLDSSYLAIEMALCFGELRQHDKAEQFARTATRGAGSLGRRHTISLAVLATACLNQKDGDVHEAVTTARTALRQLDRDFITASRERLGPA
jgi:hypothetical protein